VQETSKGRKKLYLPAEKLSANEHGARTRDASGGSSPGGEKRSIPVMARKIHTCPSLSGEGGCLPVVGVGVGRQRGEGQATSGGGKKGCTLKEQN